MIEWAVVSKSTVEIALDSGENYNMRNPLKFMRSRSRRDAGVLPGW